jgi:hypothetical protein
MEDNSTINLLSNLILSSNSSVSDTFYGLKLVFETKEPSHIRIYEVISISYQINKVLLDNFEYNNWEPNVGTAFYYNNGSASVSTTGNVTWGYISLKSSIQMNSTEFSNVAIALKGDGNSSTSFWIGLIDSNGEWHKLPDNTRAPSTLTSFIYNLPEASELSIKNIYIGVAGGNANSVQYEWILFYNSTITEIGDY